jgi:hypothetical protein
VRFEFPFMTLNRKYGGQTKCDKYRILENHYKYILEKIN